MRADNFLASGDDRPASIGDLDMRTDETVIHTYGREQELPGLTAASEESITISFSARHF